MAKRILVLSGKGGVGKSSLSVLLANALSFSGKRTLLIDADAGFKSLDLMTQTGSRVVYNWLDVILNRCSAEDAAVSLGMNEPALLGAPDSLSDGEITDETIKALFDSLDENYDYILTDAPAGFGDFHKTLMKACGHALVVATPDAVSVRSAGTAVNDALYANENADIRLIVNRFIKKDVQNGRQLNLDAAVDGAGARLIGVVPEDAGIKRLPSESFMREKTREAIMRTAKRLRGESVPLGI